MESTFGPKKRIIKRLVRNNKIVSFSNVDTQISHNSIHIWSVVLIQYLVGIDLDGNKKGKRKKNTFSSIKQYTVLFPVLKMYFFSFQIKKNRSI